MDAFLIQPTSLSLLLPYHWRRLSSRLHRLRLALHTRGWNGLIARIKAGSKDTVSTETRERHHVAPARTACSGKRILVVDVTTPRPDRDSGSVRAVNLMRAMVVGGHAVDFLPDDRRDAGHHGDLLHSNGVQVHVPADWKGYPDWFARHGTNYDIVVVSRYHLGEFLIPLLRKQLPKALVVLDTVDLHFLREQREAQLHGDRMLGRLAERTRHRELRAIANANASWVVSPVERDLLRSILPDARVLVMPNIVEATDAPTGFEHREGLLFVGGALHPPNVDAARWLLEDIFPRVLERLPRCPLHIVGAGLPEALVDVDVPTEASLHGFVPDLARLLAGSRVGLAPLRFGAGVKGKVNAYMAAGMPTVATSCAAEGMHACDGRELLVADSPDAFADAIARVYSDELLWERLSLEGLRNVQQYFSQEVALETLQETISGAG